MTTEFVIEMGEPHDHLDWIARIWASTGLHGIISTTVDRTLFATHCTLLSLKLKNRTIYSAAEALGYQADEWFFTNVARPELEIVETKAGPVPTSALVVYIDCTGQRHIGCFRFLNDAGLASPLPVFYRHLTHECTPLAVVGCWKYATAEEVTEYERQINTALDEALAERQLAEERKIAQRPPELRDGIVTISDDEKTITVVVAADEEDPFMLVDFHVRAFTQRKGIKYDASDLNDAVSQLKTMGIDLIVETYQD